MLKHWTRWTGSGGLSSRNSAVFSVEEDLTELDRQVRQNMEQVSVFVCVSVCVFVSVYTSNDFVVPSRVWRKTSQSWTDK